MITYQKAKQLLDPGDVVYTIQGGRVIEHIVRKLYADSLDTDEDVFFYDEVGKLWFLTKRAALDCATACGR